MARTKCGVKMEFARSTRPNCAKNIISKAIVYTAKDVNLFTATLLRHHS